MMRFLRRFRRLNIWAFALLRRRLAALVRAKSTYLALLAIVAVPVSWSWLIPGDTDYLGPWLILSSSLALLGLNGKVPQRKNIRRPLPAKIFWMWIGISALGFVNLAVLPLTSNTSELSVQITGIISLAAFVSIVVILLPYILIYSAHVLAPICLWKWRFGVYSTPSNVYGLFLMTTSIFGLLSLTVTTIQKPCLNEESIIIIMVLFINTVAFFLRHEPWRRTTSLAAAIIPHVAPIYYLAFFMRIFVVEEAGLRSLEMGLAPIPFTLV